MGDLNHQVVLYRGSTPFDTNMEPENTPFKKEKYLQPKKHVDSMAAMTQKREAYGKGLALWGAHVGSGI